jgi:hypothetical protein
MVNLSSCIRINILPVARNSSIGFRSFGCMTFLAGHDQCALV